MCECGGRVGGVGFVVRGGGGGGGPGEHVVCAGYVAVGAGRAGGAPGGGAGDCYGAGGGWLVRVEGGDEEGRDLLDDGVSRAACLGVFERVDETDGGEGNGEFDGAAGGFVGVGHEEMFGDCDVALNRETSPVSQ